MNIKKLIQEHKNKKRSWKASTPLDKNLKKNLKILLTNFNTAVIIINVVRKCRCSSMAEFQPSKLAMRVRFPLPAPFEINLRTEKFVSFFIINKIKKEEKIIKII